MSFFNKLFLIAALVSLPSVAMLSGGYSENVRSDVYPSDFGAVCDGHSHLLTNGIEADQIGWEKSVAKALSREGATIKAPGGTCLMSRTLEIYIPPKRSLAFEGSELASKLIFPAGVDGFHVMLGVRTVLSPASGREIEPHVTFSRLWLLTLNQVVSNTAIRISNDTSGTLASVSQISQQLRGDRLVFGSPNDADNGLDGAWAIGFDVQGISDGAFTNSKCTGGIHDTLSICLSLVARRPGSGLVNWYLDHDEVNFGGAAIRIGSAGSNLFVQGIRVFDLTTVGNNFDIVAEGAAARGNDYLMLANSNLNSRSGSIVENWDDVKMHDNIHLPIGNHYLFTIIGGKRHDVHDDTWIGSARLVLRNVLCAVDGRTVLHDNSFANVSRPPVLLSGDVCAPQAHDNSVSGNSTFGAPSLLQTEPK